MFIKISNVHVLFIGIFYLNFVYVIRTFNLVRAPTGMSESFQTKTCFHQKKLHILRSNIGKDATKQSQQVFSSS